MSTDVLPVAQGPPRPPRPHRRSDRRNSSQGRWWRRGLATIGLVVMAASVIALIPGARRSRQIASELTHTITRGDVIVAVREQGILESSENTEIKCEVRGRSTVTWVIDGGTEVKPGDELVRLDTQVIDDAISERSKYAHWSRSGAERSRADVERAKLAVPEYLEGRYLSQLRTLEKDLAIAESNVRTERNMRDHAKRMAERGYVSELQVEEREFAVTQAELNVDVTNAQIEALKDFTKAMELKTLEGNLNAAKARLKANEERAEMDAARRDLAKDELEHCVVKAEKGGLVIHPSAAQWKSAPEIEVGATVHKEQVLLLMPDLSKMQVKLGIRESAIDRVKPGMAARVTLPDRTLDGEVSSVASVAAPAGLLTGNVVRYDTIIELPSDQGLKPGMSAEVEVIVDRHENVLMIPVAAVVETAEGDFCWVKTAEGAQRRSLGLGSTNDVFTVVKAGLKEGDEVMLNPLAFMEEAQKDALKTFEETKRDERDSAGSAGKRKPEDASSGKPAGDSQLEKAKKKTAKPQADSKPRVTGDQTTESGDKNGKPKKP